MRKVLEMLRLLRSANVTSLVGFVCIALINAVALVIIAHHYPESQFGEWVMFLEGCVLIDTVRYGTIHTGLMKFLSEGSSREEGREFIGASWLMGIVLSLAIGVLMFAALILFPRLRDSGFRLLLYGYPIQAVASLPSVIGVAALQAGRRVPEMLVLRLLNPAVFTLLLLVGVLFFGIGIEGVLATYVGATAVSSVFALVAGHSGLGSLSRTSRKSIRGLLEFGKYSAVSLLCSSLLRGTSFFIIGWFMTKSDVATYSIPFQIFNGFYVVLNSLSAVAFPGLSRAAHLGDYGEFWQTFRRYLAGTTILFVPAVAIGLVFARTLIRVVGGAQYAESDVAVNLLRMMMLASLLLPLDRYLGDVSDGMGCPKYNFMKTAASLSVNVAGCLVATWYFQSLMGVSLVLILGLLVGVVVGSVLLRRRMDSGLREMRVEAA
jgi:O-antigen/teichoic acid export membrane protein